MLPDTFIKEVNNLGLNLVVFSVVRNENLRIRAWLRHYRRIGVKIFAVVDNGSTDGTFEFLSKQPDVILTRMTQSFASSDFGVQWLNEFHRRINPLTWVLFADADEFLIYRHWPDCPVTTLTELAVSEGGNAIFGFLLDMYPEGPLEDATISEEEDPIRVAPCFDREYFFRLQPRKPWGSSNKILEIVGGPRVRMLSSFEREKSSTWVARFLRGQIDRALPLTPDHLLPSLIRLFPRQMPSLSKTPLALAGTGVNYVNNHDVEGATFFRENVVFCHFKFLADFASRARQEAMRREHYRRGAEYIMYADAIARGNQIHLANNESLRFESVEQLIELGLIRDVRSFLA